MKTNDSVMREIKDICTYHGDEGTSGYCLSNEQFDKIEALYSHSLAEARRELIDEIYDWGKSIKNGRDVYNPRMSMVYLERLHYEQHKSDLLTGDNPEEAK
jgi:hypothetical protein